ncbi:MAG: argininosuccinate lyase [Candidatus Bathyarchaeia archaeon]
MSIKVRVFGSLVYEGVYRSRLTKGYGVETAKFVSSLQDDLWLAMEDIDGTEAHDIMLSEQGIITKLELKAILWALEKVRANLLEPNPVLESGFEDIHEYVESQVISLIGIEKGGRMHTARSRNDQVALDLRMKLRVEIVETIGLILDLMRTLHSRALEEINTLAPLYTHTQHAQAGVLAHYYAYYMEVLGRSCERLLDCYKRVNMSPLGACAVGGTSFPIDRAKTMKLLGFDGLVENSLDAVSSRDFAVEAVACLANLMADLSRMAEDLILWSTWEYGYVELADEYASTSSVMPHKKNPCPLELMRGRAGTVYSALINLLTQIKGTPSGYNRDLQESKIPVKVSFEAAKSSLKVLQGVFSTLKINRDRLREAVEKGFSTAVDLAEALTMRHGISFRESHMIVGRMVMKLANSGKGIRDVKPEDLEKASQEVLGRMIHMSPKELESAIDPSICVSHRRSGGSSAPMEVRRSLKNLRETMSKFEAAHQSLSKNLRKYRETLRKKVAQYLEG